ncbi:hypothetical protein E3T46_13825 [Cryobacterium sp. Hh11]|uniref:hypothetical protein n=1 Tax=Cryobacterium sp. Hh11 TaxID=2555868 RepID=UPI00106A4401|nr:hypothetical protein [Cryobacterium sp. Hh11]TFD49507.1 hypothetical protein E3T46_13825 [Cryobacterium sp. Hh11]
MAETSQPSAFAHNGWVVEALQGASCVPAEWRRVVHGWPGLTSADLMRLGERVADNSGAKAKGSEE